MLIKFLQIDKITAIGLAEKIDEIYTPFKDTDNKYFFYKDNYEVSEYPFLIELEDSYVDGLTPTDPTKPMFPKKS